RHPSPGRALGALLAGAYRSGSDRALAAVRDLAHAPQPAILLPDTGTPVSVHAYSVAQVPWDHGTALGRGVGKSDGASKLGIGPTRHGRDSQYVLLGPGAAYHFVTDDGLDVEGLSLAAEHVSSLGQGSDLSAASVTTWPEPVGQMLAHTGDTGAVRLRAWSPSLIDWYDHQHEAIHVACRAGGFVPDHRVAETGYSPVKVVGGVERVVIATTRALPASRLPEVMAAVIGDEPLPMVDQRGRVRGVSAVSGPAGIGTTDDTLLDLTIVPTMRCQE